MVQKLRHYVDLVDKVFKASDVKEQINRFADIDKMLACEYDNPPSLQGLSWIGDRKLVSTAPADAANAATRTFASRQPIISVLPLSDMPEEYARAERVETALDWELMNMNTKGRKPIHWQIVESAMKYCKVALQVEYLPYMLKDRKKDGYVKAVLQASKFNWRIHHPGTVFCQDGPYGLPEFVVKKSKYPVNYLVSKYGKDNKGVRDMLASLDKKDIATQLDTDVYFFDVTTWEDRVQWASMDEKGDAFEFMREEHNLPFLPWVVVDNEDPILKSVIDANLWNNANALRTIVFSKAIDMAAHPELWIATATGDLTGVEIDNTNPSQPVVTDLNANVQQLRPPQIDQQLANVQQMADSEIFRTSVAQILASIEDIGRTATFSTVNAMLQAAISQLSLAQNAAERAEQLAFKQSLHWIAHSKIPLTMYRNKNKTVGDMTYGRGSRIMITGPMDEVSDEMLGEVTEIDPEYLYLEVKLQSISITDEQAQMTNAINKVDRLGASRAIVFDEYGYGDYAQHEAKRAIEDMTEAEKQAEIQRIMMAPQEEMQQRQMEQQMQMQQEQQQQVAIENARLQGQTAFEGQQGFDPRAGMAPPMGAAPGMGREQVTGETFTGEGLA